MEPLQQVRKPRGAPERSRESGVSERFHARSLLLHLLSDVSSLVVNGCCYKARTGRKSVQTLQEVLRRVRREDCHSVE
ncbi:hypothetical protein EYF80_006731 [Liparis tanakae]|uniref:Uncharacterized protein n=1 Tax=Liparis tanakae TaxID=230148 RepID=A0A4Z2IZW6_9TELE|nr:hypothetical protein EYF80_006731 [Liparis tanakae]